MGQGGITDSAHIEDGQKIRPEQLNYGDAIELKFSSKRQNQVVVAFGIVFVLLVATCTVLAVLWALKRSGHSIYESISHDKNGIGFSHPSGFCLNEHCIYAATSILQNMDQTVDPCEDFYQYACGNWAQHNPLPDDKPSYDMFNKLKDVLQVTVKELLSAPINLDDSNATTNAKRLYQSCMNESLIEDRKDEPLQNLIKLFGGWPVLDSNWNESTFDYSEFLGQLKLYNNDIMITQWVGADPHNSTLRSIQLDQPEFGLPSREYYLQEDTKVLDAYYKFMVDIAELLGADSDVAKKDMTEILIFEQKLANLTEPAERRRNYTLIQFKVTLGELHELVPQINWTRYFEIFVPISLNDTEEIAVFSYPYLRRLGRLLEVTPKRIVANYLMWRFVNHRINNLDRRFMEKRQEFLLVLLGRAKEPERWKTCSNYVNAVMGMSVGAMFVKNHFKESSKHDAEEMINNIQDTFIEILRTLDWMDKETKQMAIEKAKRISKKIGYPEFILDPEDLDKDNDGGSKVISTTHFYVAFGLNSPSVRGLSAYREIIQKQLEFNSTSYFENVLLNLRHMARWEQEKLRIPINKTLWSTAPVVVNAFYSRSKNQILFPAGILQPPFFHSSYPKSLNYGGIGVVIGHEISHGFDDRGRQFDLEGNLKLWWSPESIDRFHKKAQCLIDQYNNYEVTEVSQKINGIVTQGENLADNGGIRQAFQAYQKWIKKHGEEPLLPGVNLTHTQLFFLNFAQVWCNVMTPEAAISKLRQGPHSPGRFRVIGTLSNSEDFSKAYQCPEGSQMNPKEKCSFW